MNYKSAVVAGVILACAASAVLAAKPAEPNYPTRSIRFVVPFAAG